jgi:hypothetical protein
VTKETGNANAGWNKPANISWNRDSSPKKSSEKRYLQSVDISSGCHLLPYTKYIKKQKKQQSYSEVAVSIRSFCKLLKRTSYGYFCDLASAI